MVWLIALVFTSLVAAPGREPRLLVSTTEAAEMLSISHRHLLNLIEGGEVRTIKLGRRRMVPVAGLEEMIARRLGDAS